MSIDTASFCFFVLLCDTRIPYIVDRKLGRDKYPILFCLISLGFIILAEKEMWKVFGHRLTGERATWHQHSEWENGCKRFASFLPNGCNVLSWAASIIRNIVFNMMSYIYKSLESIQVPRSPSNFLERFHSKSFCPEMKRNGRHTYVSPRKY